MEKKMLFQHKKLESNAKKLVKPLNLATVKKTQTVSTFTIEKTFKNQTDVISDNLSSTKKPYAFNFEQPDVLESSSKRAELHTQTLSAQLESLPQKVKKQNHRVYNKSFTPEPKEVTRIDSLASHSKFGQHSETHRRLASHVEMDEEYDSLSLLSKENSQFNTPRQTENQTKLSTPLLTPLRMEDELKKKLMLKLNLPPSYLNQNASRNYKLNSINISREDSPLKSSTKQNAKIQPKTTNYNESNTTDSNPYRDSPLDIAFSSQGLHSAFIPAKLKKKLEDMRRPAELKDKNSKQSLEQQKPFSQVPSHLGRNYQKSKQNNEKSKGYLPALQQNNIKELKRIDFKEGGSEYKPLDAAHPSVNSSIKLKLTKNINLLYKRDNFLGISNLTMRESNLPTFINGSLSTKSAKQNQRANTEQHNSADYQRTNQNFNHYEQYVNDKFKNQIKHIEVKFGSALFNQVQLVSTRGPKVNSARNASRTETNNAAEIFSQHMRVHSKVDKITFVRGDKVDNQPFVVEQRNPRSIQNKQKSQIENYVIHELPFDQSPTAPSHQNGNNMNTPDKLETNDSVVEEKTLPYSQIKQETDYAGVPATYAIIQDTLDSPEAFRESEDLVPPIGPWDRTPSVHMH